jgi:hypothetical protein
VGNAPRFGIGTPCRFSGHGSVLTSCGSLAAPLDFCCISSSLIPWMPPCRDGNGKQGRLILVQELPLGPPASPSSAVSPSNGHAVEPLACGSVCGYVGAGSSAPARAPRLFAGSDRGGRPRRRHLHNSLIIGSLDYRPAAPRVSARHLWRARRCGGSSLNTNVTRTTQRG